MHQLTATSIVIFLLLRTRYRWRCRPSAPECEKREPTEPEMNLGASMESSRTLRQKLMDYLSSEPP
jgi:hypothetical protein